MPSQAALSQLKVLDLSRVLAGPWCTQLLADLGADVIKVERPHSGDDTRGWGPPYLKDDAGQDTTESAYYLAANRGKRSITVDLATAAGQQLIRQLAAQCDVFVENYKLGQLGKYGLDYQSLSALNPRLIYCSITGFGQDGPYKDRAGYDFIIQGMSGLMSITGERDDQPGGGPQKAGVAVTDLMTGMYASVAILAALEQRHQSGHGQHLDLALLDSAVAMLANMNMNYLVTNRAPGRVGNAHTNIVPYQVFSASDGQLVIAVGNDAQFQKLCHLLQAPLLATDARFRSNASRVKHRQILVSLLQQQILQHSVQWWLTQLEPAGIPCGPINSIEQAFNDPQVKARGLRIEQEHPLNKQVPLVASPIVMNGQRAAAPLPPPLLGQHSQQVLADWLGLDETAIQALAQKGALGSRNA